MKFDGVFIESLINEINQDLHTARIQKITQPSPREFLFTIRSNGKKQTLLISMNKSTPRFHFTENTYEANQTPSSLCLLLRKLFDGGIITKVMQHSFDRIVEFNIEKRNELGDIKTHKIFLFFRERRSNFIVTNDENIIVTALSTDSLEEVEYPVIPKHPLVITTDSTAIFTNTSTIDKANGISAFTKSLLSNDWRSELQLSIDCPNPILLTVDNKLAFTFLNTASGEKHPTLSNLLDTFYYQTDIQNRLKSSTQNVKKAIEKNAKKLKTKLEKLQNQKSKNENADNLKKNGDLIFMQMQNIKYTPGGSSVCVIDYLDTQKEIDIVIDKKISLHENAKLYYKKYSKAKKSIKFIDEQIIETKQKIIYFDQIIFQLETSQSISEINEIIEELQKEKIIKEKYNKSSKKTKLKKTKAQNNYLSFEFETFTCLVGKTNIQNDTLTFQVANQNDYWFHVKNVPGSHVILKDSDEPYALETAAKLAAHFSKLRGSAKIPIDYTFKKHVKKIPRGNPGFVTYSNYDTIIIDDNITSLEDFMKEGKTNDA